MLKKNLSFRPLEPEPISIDISQSCKINSRVPLSWVPAQAAGMTAARMEQSNG